MSLKNFIGSKKQKIESIEKMTCIFSLHGFKNNFRYKRSSDRIKCKFEPVRWLKIKII